MGDGYSLAWRMLDAAQGWGVAQRRKRVFAVLDLAGQRAGQVLFESEGVSGYTPPGGKAGKELPRVLREALEWQAARDEAPAASAQARAAQAEATGTAKNARPRCGEENLRASP